MNNPIKILFIEDLPSTVKSVEHELLSNNIRFESICVRTRDNFLKQLSDFRPDIIISSPLLTNFSGREALQIKMERSPNTPFIVLLDSETEKIADEFIKAGAAGFVSEQQITRIVPSIQSALEGAPERTGTNKIEHELAQYLERLNFALRGIRAGVWEWDIVNDCKSYSQEWAFLLGYKPEDLTVPEFWRNTIHPDDLPAMQANIDSYMQGKKPLFENIHRKRCKNGEWIWVLDRGEIVERDNADNPTHMTGIIIDITSQKRAEEDRDRLMKAIEQTSETFVITDADGIIQYVNSAFEATTGYSSDEAIGQNPRILKSGKQDDEFYQKMWETLSSGDVWRGHLINRRKDGSLFEEEATISPVRDINGKTVNYIAVKRNVTRERQLEEQLLQSQKMEAVGRLAGGVAHDFNNLLTIINGNAELLSTKFNGDERLEEGLQLIREMVDRGTALTRQLLTFSRRQPQQPKVINLNIVLQGMYKMLRPLIGEHIDLRYDLFDNLPNIRADVGQIEQIVMNLLVNSRDAMPNGGRINVKTTITEFYAGEFTETLAVTAGKYCVLSVTDTGMGMPKDVKMHALEPFYTTKPIGKGTGLGLSTVHGIATSSGGMVQIESEENIGTTILIYLPVVDEAADVMLPNAHENIQGKNEHILLVEDDKAILDVVTQSLSQYNYRITTANNGMEALAVLAHEAHDLQLILTDVIMPHVSGPQFVDWVKSKYPWLKVVYMSGYTSETIVHQIQEQGLMFIQKPFKTNDLLHILRLALDSH